MSKLNRIAATTLAFALTFLTFAGSALAAGKPAPTGKVNINTASVEQLEALPGVGPKLAARIVEYRQKSGTFKSACFSPFRSCLTRTAKLGKAKVAGSATETSGADYGQYSLSAYVGF